MSLPDFRNFAESTAADWQRIASLCEAHERTLADRVLGELKNLQGNALGFPVDRCEHSLQTATRALRDGADEETVVCALLHDIGDELAPYAHGDLAAVVLKPYVSEENAWIVAKHAIFQGYHYFHHIGRDRNERERYRGHPHFEKCAAFCERWDQAAFDRDYDTMPLAAFEPMVRRIFARAPYGGAAVAA